MARELYDEARRRRDWKMGRPPADPSGFSLRPRSGAGLLKAQGSPEFVRSLLQLHMRIGSPLRRREHRGESAPERWPLFGSLCSSQAALGSDPVERKPQLSRQLRDGVKAWIDFLTALKASEMIGS